MTYEIRTDGTLHIDGYVNAVERDSNPLIAKGVGKCVEQVKAGAFGMALRAAENVDMLLNHDTGHKLASTGEGTLELREDSIGLHASADITDEFVISKAKAGLLRGWSFGFKAVDEEIEKRGEKLPRRIIKGMKLFEVSIIDDTKKPCYNGSSVEYRADEEIETRCEDDYTGVSVELLRRRLELIEAEYRYNHYHDPHNGRFASGAGGATGLYYSYGKGKGGVYGGEKTYNSDQHNGGYFESDESNKKFRKSVNAFLKDAQEGDIYTVQGGITGGKNYYRVSGSGRGMMLESIDENGMRTNRQSRKLSRDSVSSMMRNTAVTLTSRQTPQQKERARVQRDKDFYRWLERQTGQQSFF